MGCCGNAEEGSASIVPSRSRWCTDVLCLLIYVAFGAAVVFVGVLAIITGDIRHLIFPKDYSGQFCGSSSAVADLEFAWFPRLDKDINEAITAGALSPVNPFGFALFKPYAICVAACPEAFSTTNLISYGGPDYPYSNTSGVSAPDTYYALRGTRLAARYCLPSTKPAVSDARQLCVSPVCTDPAVSAVGGICTPSPATTTNTDNVTAWEVSTDAQEALCALQVKEELQVEYTPPLSSEATQYWERQFATYLDNSFNAFDAVVAARDQVLVTGVAAPFVLGFVWLIVLYLFAGAFVYAALFLLLLGLLVGCFYLYAKAGAFDVGDLIGLTVNSTSPAYGDALQAVAFLEPAEANEQVLYTIAAVIASIALVLYVLALLVLRKQISRCVALVRESTKVFKSMFALAFYPFVGQAFCALLIAYGAVVGAFIATESEPTWSEIHAIIEPAVNGSGSIDDALSTLNSLDPTLRTALLLLIHVFGVLWAIQFTLACTYTTYVRCPAAWFFAHEQGELKASFGCGVGTLLAGAAVVITKHLGTMALGSLLVTLITAIRIVFEYFARWAKKQAGSEPPLMLKLVLCCTKCCLWCLQKTLQYILGQAYIFVAIRGVGFCTAGWKTFGLIKDAGGQLVVNQMVGSVLSIAIGLSIPTLCAVGCFVWLDRATDIEPTWPALLVFLAGFVIASGIAQVFQCVIDTLFICTHLDLHENKQAPKHMPKGLRKAFEVDKPKKGDGSKDDDGKDTLIVPDAPGPVVQTF